MYSKGFWQPFAPEPLPFNSLPLPPFSLPKIVLAAGGNSSRK